MVITHLPERGLGGNSRKHNLAKAGLVRDERAAFGLEVLSLAPRSRWPVFGKGTTARIRWVVYVPEWRGDWDNWVMALKPWQDALVDVGLLPKDGPTVLRGGSVEVVKAGAARVEMYIETRESEGNLDPERLPKQKRNVYH